MLGLVKERIDSYFQELQQLRAKGLDKRSRARIRAIRDWADQQMDEATAEMLATTQVMAMALEGEQELKFGHENALAYTAWQMSDHAETLRRLYELADVAYYLLHPASGEDAA